MYRSLFFRICTALLLLFSLSLPAFAASPQGIYAKACVLMLADTREVLYAENENEQLSMASTTKIMTSLLALESGLWEQQIKVTSDMVAVEGTSIGLLPDDLISVRTLISGMLLESGNDAANVTAYAVAGGQAQFLELMNQKAAEIGNTVVIVTADHETGGLEYNGESKEQLSDKMYTRTRHSDANVAYFVFGTVDCEFPEVIDNTQIGNLCKSIISAGTQ